MDPSQEESIRKPLLDIKYKVYETQLIDEKSDIDVSYFVDMFEDDTSFEKSEKIVGIIFNCFAFVIVSVRMFVWYRMNPPRHYNHPAESHNFSK